MAKQIEQVLAALDVIRTFLMSLLTMRLTHSIFAPDPNAVTGARVVGVVIATNHDGISDWDKDVSRKPYLLKVLNWLADLRLFNTVAIHFNLDELKKGYAGRMMAPFPFTWYLDNINTQYAKTPNEFENYLVLAMQQGATRAIIDDANVKVSVEARTAIINACKKVGLVCIQSFNTVDVNHGRAFMTEAPVSPEYAMQGYLDNGQAVSTLAGWLKLMKDVWTTHKVPTYAHLQFFKPSATGATLPAAKLRATCWLYWLWGVRSYLVYGIDDLTDWTAVDLGKDGSPISDAMLTLFGFIAWVDSRHAEDLQNEMAA